MDFYTVLDQVVALLRSRGRVSYRALKRQFALDDELLADLTAELRYAHYPIADDHDQGLVWTGETAPPYTPDCTAQCAGSVAVAPRVAASVSAARERRPRESGIRASMAWPAAPGTPGHGKGRP
jgi:hypothetical protein